MKEIYAFWEERNTGLITGELLFDSNDTIDDFRNSFNEKNYEYLVAKVPKENINLVHGLEESGFRFLETQLTISVSVKELENLKTRWSRFLERTNIRKLTEKKDLEILLKKIEDGIFREDRISLDDILGEKISTKRYINWISDIYKENSAEIFILLKNSTDVGFFIIKKSGDTIYQALIAGIYNDHQGKGLSLALFYYYLKLAAEHEAKNVITSFSSNNLKMLNSFTKTISFKVMDILYVLRKIRIR